MTDLNDARLAKRKIEEFCRRLPQLRGLGITRVNGEYAVRVDLSEPVDEPIPAEIDGVRVQVEVVGTIEPLSRRG